MCSEEVYTNGASRGERGFIFFSQTYYHLEWLTVSPLFVAASQQVSHGLCIISTNLLYLGYLRRSQMTFQASI